MDELASPGTSQTSTPHVAANFISAASSSTVEPILESGCARLRSSLKRILQGPRTDCSLGVVVLVDIVCTISDIDSRAAGTGPDIGFETASMLCSAFYLADFCIRLFTFGHRFLLEFWGILDGFVIIAAIVDIVVEAVGAAVDIGMLRCLRVARVMRLLRVVRRFRWLAELRKLIQMCGACIKTLMWSMIFCFGVMTVWSMLAVEFVNPLMDGLVEKGEFADCLRCQTSMRSVMRANLLFFQVVITGDSWGEIAIPIIESYPAAAIIFMGAQLTLVFGVLNLIVAVVVDSAAEQRATDVSAVAEDMELDSKEDLKFLQDMFTKIDLDQSGRLDFEELIQGAKTIPEFRDRLRVMDIDQSDLEQLFLILDESGDGVIEPKSFIHALSRWKFASKTADRFVKYNLLRSMKNDNLFYDLATRRFDQLEEEIREMKHRIAISPGDQEEQSSKVEPPTLAVRTLESQPDCDYSRSCPGDRALSCLTSACLPESLSSGSPLGSTVTPELRGQFENASRFVREALVASLRAAEATLRSAAFSAAEQAFRESIAALLCQDAHVAPQVGEGKARAAIPGDRGPEATEPCQEGHDGELQAQKALPPDVLRCLEQVSQDSPFANLEQHVRV